jgi:cell division protein FtsB
MPRLRPAGNRRAALAYAAAVVGLLALSVLDPGGLRKALRNEAEAERLQRENASLEQRVARLRREVKALQGDPAALERAAREELGYVKPGEIVYKLDEVRP